MSPAVIAAGVVAAGTIGGAVLGNSAQKKASTQAAQTQNNATDAQLQLGRESLGLNRDIYNSNYDILSPYASRGNVAGDQINALLGLPSAPVMHSPLATTPSAAGAPAPAAPAQSGYSGPGLGQIGSQGQMDAYMGYYQAHPEQDPGFTNISQFHGDPYKNEDSASAVLAAHNAYLASHPATPAAPAPAPAPGAPPAAAPPGTPAPGASPAPTPTSALNDFANSAGMQFQLQQGTNALNNLYAAHGVLQSGAAMKGINDYAQHTALNNYFMPYMGLLGGQQAVGAGAASSVAGVGANFGNTAANINNSMGNAINNGAQNIGNLQLANGQNQSNMYGAIGGALGGMASSFFPTPKY